MVAESRRTGAKMALLTEERYALCPLWQQLVQFWPHELVAVTRNSPVLLKIFPDLEAIWLKAEPGAPLEKLLALVDGLAQRGSRCQLIACLDEADGNQMEQLLAHGVDEIIFNATVQAAPRILLKTMMVLQAQRDRVKDLKADINRQRKSLQSKTEFLTWLSHEIRTPMNGVLGMIDLFQHSELSPDQSEMVDIMARSGQRVVDLLSEILDMSRLDGGKMVQHNKDFQLRRCIEDCLSLYARDANLRGLMISDLVDADVPDALCGDERKLSQILNNLLSNAVKYTQQGYVLMMVRIEAWDGEQCRLRFDIQDTGHGIAPEEAARVFEPFEQTESAHLSRAPSSGLGLSLTRRLVELLGGTILFKSRLGEGSTFSFSLPFTQAQKPGLLPLQNLRSQKAVIISEDPGKIYVLGELLQRGNARVVTHKPGEVLPEADWYFFGEQRDWERRAPGLHIDPRFSRVFVLKNPLMDRQLSAEGRKLTLPAGCEYLELPIKQSDLYRRLTSELMLEASSPSLRPDLARKTWSFKGARILVVDDEPVNLKVAERQLRRLNADITLASSGVEALDWLEKKHFDLIFVDCQMPHMDGFEFVKLMRTMPQMMPGTPVIALTALGRDEDRERALQLGFTDYLAKPAHMDDIRKLLGRWLPHEIKFSNS